MAVVMRSSQGLALVGAGIALAIFGFAVVEVGVQTRADLNPSGLALLGVFFSAIGAVTCLLAAFLIRE